MKFKANTAWTN